MKQPDDEIIQPTRERLRRAPGYDELLETLPGGVTKKSGAKRLWTQLENLFRNHILTDEQYQAGQRYYADHELAGFSPRITSRFEEWIQGMAGSPGNLDAAERRVFHQKRWAQANVVLEELGVRKSIHWLVINDIKPEHIGRSHWGYSGKHSATAGAVTGIRIGLTRLAKFYGIAN